MSSSLNRHPKYGNTLNMSQRPTGRKRSQTGGRRSFVLLISSNPLGLHPEAKLIFKLCPASRPAAEAHNLTFVTTGSVAASVLMSVRVWTNVCKLASLRSLSDATVTLSCTHIPPFFYPIHANTHFSHIFLKDTKKHWITVGQWTKAGHHGNKLRGTGAVRVCVCSWDGSWCLRYWFWVSWGGGALQEQLLHLISLYWSPNFTQTNS